MTSPAPFEAQKRERPLNLAVTAAITVLITVAMTTLSISFGGFGSNDAMSSEARGFSLPIIIHLATAVPALLLGPVVVWRRKGDNLHRWLGRAWVSLMLVTAVSSAFIHSPGAGVAGTGYSFIHIFTIWTLVNVPLGVWFARSGRIAAHRGVMTGLYVGLVIAGTLL